MTVLDVHKQSYGRPLSSVFGAPEKMFAQLLEDDADPILDDLLVINYRYVRFFYHPLKDKFVICSGWKDPAWTHARPLRSGIDAEEKEHRESVFGSNLIDIEQKSMTQLLVDEVCHHCVPFRSRLLNPWPGSPSVLHIPNRKLDSLVT